MRWRGIRGGVGIVVDVSAGILSVVAAQCGSILLIELVVCLVFDQLAELLDCVLELALLLQLRLSGRPSRRPPGRTHASVPVELFTLRVSPPARPKAIARRNQ